MEIGRNLDDPHAPNTPTVRTFPGFSELPFGVFPETAYKVSRNPNGLPVDVNASCQEVCAPESAEWASKKFRQSFALDLQALIDGLDEQVALIGRDGTILLVNRKWRRTVEQRGYWDFHTGRNYENSLARLAEAGDTRIDPILAAFREISSGARRSFHCVYFGSGPFSGHDYNIRFSLLSVGGEPYVLVSAQEVTELHKLQRQRRGVDTRVLRAQEHERRRLGRELHDSTSQTLVALQLTLMNLGQSAGTEAQELISECSKAVKDIQREIRSFSFIAHPPSLAGGNLANAFEDLIRGFAARTGLEIELQLSDIGQASSAVEAALYRIAQEALSNIHRHAAASRAKVRLAGTKRCLHLVVSDDGVGFDSSGAKRQQAMGVGVLGMEERVNELGGRFSIHGLQEGTVLRASIPRQKIEIFAPAMQG